jgi:hypothetical protein
MKKLISIFLFFLFYHSSFSQRVQAPADFLGYNLGERFTFHYRMLEYFKHVDEMANNVKVIEYGKTYEHRPLIYTIITSPDNFSKLEQIRLDNLIRAGIESGTPKTRIPIVWLSYNVHGNEASSMEAAMWTLYDLANPANAKTQEWLKNVVIIIDPCINPDGRDRYARFYNQYGNMPANTNVESMEHHEPWPTGRPNHYMFDLNRDWAWLTQVESKHRVKVYNEWLPHVHVDFHEMGYNTPYFFAPAAEPLHEVITPWQRDFQGMLGKNHAKYFDEKGWLYFTKEFYDLFYPSYGDTYPTYNGAIGVTYEQAGSSYAGTSVTTETGDQLTLLERITHHHTTGLSTIEVTSQNAGRVIEEFEKYFRENNTSPASQYKTYVIKSDNNKDKIKSLTSWMDAHGIKYGHTNAKASKGFDFQSQATSAVSITGEDIVISAYQPKSRFLTTVFEPVSKLPDSLTYDITAWNLMYAHNLRGFALTEKLPVTKAYQEKASKPVQLNERPYAYIFRYQHLQDVQLLTALMTSGVKVRASEKSFTINGQTYAPGTLIVTRRNNEHLLGFDSLIVSKAKSFNRDIIPSYTGFVEKGKDFGSGDLNYIKAPKVATLFGAETSALNSGEIWHFFEQQIHYPVTQIGSGYFKHVDLKPYDVLIIPEGYYTVFDEEMQNKLSAWVTAGGRLILIGNANNQFSDKPGFALKKFASEEEKTEAEKRAKALKEKEGMPRYDETERRTVSETISGAIYKVSIDNSHPLAFGLDNYYYTLKNNEYRFAFLDNGWNVGVFKGNVKPVMGFAGFKSNTALQNSIVFAVENKGEGEIVYMVDNPLFRAFWDNGKLLFSNAVFMVGQ